MKISNEEKTEILLEAMHYISKFQNKIFIIKIGGSILTNDKTIKPIMEDIAFLKKIGIKIIIVHGGGKDINHELKIHNIEPKFVNGTRFTDNETMEIAEMVLSGKVNKKLVAEANKQDILAVGICGKDGCFMQAEKQRKLGNVGNIKKINTKLINALLENNFVPIISPICFDKNFKALNVNADDVASKIAKELKAEKLIFLTDIDGIFKDINNKQSIIPTISTKDVNKMIKEGIITGGMIPKILSCCDVIKNGINAVHIINGKIKHSMLLEIYTNKGIGTIIK